MIGNPRSLDVKHDKVLIADINFTQSQLEKALHDAIDFRANMARSTRVSSNAGIMIYDKPDWAVSLSEKHDLCKAVIEKIGSLTFVKRRPDDLRPFEAYIQSLLDKKEPLIFRVAFGPLKNVNLPACMQAPDLAEYLTLTQLARFASAIAAIYPYGVKAHIVPDNMRAQTANRCPVSCVRGYIDGLIDLVQAIGFQDWLTVEWDQARLYELYNVVTYRDDAEKQLLDWKKQDPEAFAGKWHSACFNAQKNIPQSCHDDVTEIENAAWRYLVTHRAEILSGMWSPRDAFPLIYANHPNAYQIYSLGYKKTKLPWQISLPTSLASGTPIPGLVA